MGTIINVDTQGGPLVINLTDGTKMEGPAVTVFSGAIIF
jgi:diaminopimelate epimerase